MFLCFRCWYRQTGFTPDVDILTPLFEIKSKFSSNSTLMKRGQPQAMRKVGRRNRSQPPSSSHGDNCPHRRAIAAMNRESSAEQPFELDTLDSKLISNFSILRDCSFIFIVDVTLATTAFFKFIHVSVFIIT